MLSVAGALAGVAAVVPLAGAVLVVVAADTGDVALAICSGAGVVAGAVAGTVVLAAVLAGVLCQRQ